MLGSVYHTIGKEIHDIDGAHLSNAMSAILGLDQRARGPVPGYDGKKMEIR